MDNDALRDTYRAVNERACPYEKTILSGNGGCSLARRFCIAEREGVQCGSAQAWTDCLALLETLRRQARFALKSSDTHSALPHTKTMRLQVGGLRGLCVALAPETPAPSSIEDIQSKVAEAIVRFGALDALPYALILREIAQYQPRRRQGRER
ncbi:hypothetical protein [Thermochromatium tepidum]|uniref:Uncharacterized protein n=1 Tax=Thermochromatium tepidum ATCC 43061 TaxID=316276 RepID=A0A6I6EFN9_THETI|nr:hypothetical protein [Thermochromatium tepidum]QGU33020.1 hypothetical protein E6P07_08540 [Thermochromatium tepidum ATCC 43061]